MTITTAQPVAATRSDHAQPSVTVRPLRPGESVEVRRLFRTTLPLGRQLELQYADIVNYERQCLDWYLTHARDLARVVSLDGRTVAFAIPCFDRRALDRWTRRRAVRWGARAIYRFGVGRLGAQGRRFMELRLRDLLDARHRRRRAAGCSVLVHVTTPSPAGMEALTAAMDEIVSKAGSRSWSYDVQVRGSVLPGAEVIDDLQRLGASIDHIVLDRTLSWLAGEPVLRVTVTRPVVPQLR